MRQLPFMSFYDFLDMKKKENKTFLDKTWTEKQEEYIKYAKDVEKDKQD